MGQHRLSREEAFALLDKAGGDVKTALVMQGKQVSLEDAKRLLAEHDGHLRPILGGPR